MLADLRRVIANVDLGGSFGQIGELDLLPERTPVANCKFEPDVKNLSDAVENTVTTARSVDKTANQPGHFALLTETVTVASVYCGASVFPATSCR